MSKKLGLLILCLIISLPLLGQTKVTINAKTITPLLLPALASKDHWSKGLSLTAQVTIAKAFVARAENEWTGEIKYTLSGLPGKAQIVETATCVLRQNDKKTLELLANELVVTTSTLQNVNAPSRNLVLTSIYKVLRSNEKTTSLVADSQKIISCNLIDAYPSGKPDARLSVLFSKDASGKPQVTYAAVINCSLEGLVYEDVQNSESIKLKKVTYQFSTTFNWDGKSDWKLSDKIWEKSLISSVDYDQTLYKNELLKAIPNLQKDGIDAIWGESNELKAGKISYQQ